MVKGDTIIINIAGYLDVSFNDIIGETSYVVWLCGCNFRCPYCQNFQMVSNINEICRKVSIDKILEKYNEVRNIVEYVHITGGEPTIHSHNLIELIKKMKASGAKTSISTNGSMPNVIKALIDQHVINHIAMDIKAPLDVSKYSSAIGLSNDETKRYLDRIRRSLTFLQEIDFAEIRTTYVPKLITEEDIVSIAGMLQKYMKRRKHYYVIQQFIPNKNAPDPAYRTGKIVSIGELYKIAKKAREYIPNVVIRHIEGVKYVD